MITTHSLSV